MARIILFLAAFLGSGALLALSSMAAGFPTGWIGALGLVGWALFARRRWAAIEQDTGKEPGPPERALWIQGAGFAVLLGHLIMSLLCVGNALRLGSGNTLAIDSWTMIPAALAIDYLFQRDRNSQDERDRAISAKGIKASYRMLVCQTVALALYLPFAAPASETGFTPFLIGNILIISVLASYLVQFIVRLHAYRDDSEHQFLEETAE